MNFSLVAALVVLLAAAHGYEAVSLVKRDAQSDLDMISKFIKDTSAYITGSTQEVVDRVKAGADTAQTFIKDSSAKIQPLVDNVEAQAIKLQEQVKPFITNIDDKIKPLTANFNANFKPMTDNWQEQVKALADMMVTFFQQVVNQTKALLPRQ